LKFLKCHAFLYGFFRDKGSFFLKYIFIAIFCALILASIGTSVFNKKAASGKRVFYWVTDNNPARALQISTFQSWMKSKGYPDCELKLDTANRDVSKQIIQSVSGVGGDVMDCWSGGGDVMYFAEMGIMEDVTEDAKRLGYDPSKTYAALEDDLKVNGRQYIFPCNVNASLYFVNKEVFKRFGLEPPPMRWSMEEFEKRGKEFVAAANKGLDRREYFMAAWIDTVATMRSFGNDIFNETLTASKMTGEGNDGLLKTLKLTKKWTDVDHILPTAAEVASFATASGYGGATFQLFFKGNFAMVSTGRYALIQFRQFGKMDLDAVEYPNAGYPNTIIATRAALVYKGSKNKDLAKYFQAYLASKDYNMNIVEDADALPPNPEFTKSEEYLHPKDYPNEWTVHKKFAQDAMDISIVLTKSPFVANNQVYGSYMNECTQGVMSDVRSAEDAVKLFETRINEEIARTIQEKERLRPEYEKQCELQKKIDEYRKAGKKVPKEWISNPFYKKYYKDMGWLE